MFIHVSKWVQVAFGSSKSHILLASGVSAVLNKVQDCRNSIGNALELLQSCTKLLCFPTAIIMLHEIKYYIGPCYNWIQLGNIPLYENNNPLGHRKNGCDLEY